MAIYRGRQFTLTGSGSAASDRRRRGRRRLLRDRPRAAGARPRVPAGRGHARRGQVVILSDGSGGASSARRPTSIGRTLTLDGEAYTIVGVMPAAFSVRVVVRRLARDIWVPLA